MFASELCVSPSLPFRDDRQSLLDIRDSIDNILLFIGTMNFDAYLKDRKTQASVERELQIITEAAFRLGEEAETICPGPVWRDIRGLGNALRHAYDDINHAIIWNTVQDDLPRLRIAVEKAVSHLERSSTP